MQKLTRQQNVPPTGAKKRLSELGASMVEYALLVSLIAAICVISLQNFGDKRKQNWDKVGDAFDQALP